MSTEVFPALVGLGWDREKTPIFKTMVHESPSGKEKRIQCWSSPKWLFSFKYDFIEDTGVAGDLQSIVGFFLKRGGKFDSFLYLCPDDNAVTDQPLGTGNASAKTFQLVRTLGGYTESIGALKTLTNIKVNGVVVSSYTVQGTKIVFNNAPANGAAITGTFEYYFKVRFNEDKMDTNNFLTKLYTLKKCELISLK